MRRRDRFRHSGPLRRRGVVCSGSDGVRLRELDQGGLARRCRGRAAGSGGWCNRARRSCVRFGGERVHGLWRTSEGAHAPLRPGSAATREPTRELRPCCAPGSAVRQTVQRVPANVGFPLGFMERPGLCQRRWRAAAARRQVCQQHRNRTAFCFARGVARPSRGEPPADIGRRFIVADYVVLRATARQRRWGNSRRRVRRAPELVSGAVCWRKRKSRVPDVGKP